MPRLTKYNDQAADKIVTALRAGNTLKAAAGYVGVTYETLRVWRKRKPAFSVALDQAEAEAEVMYAATLAKAAREGDWRAALSWLERRRHDDWRERKSTEMTGPGGGPIQTEDVGLSDNDRAARILAIVQRARERATEPADAAAPGLDAVAGTTDGSVAL